VSGAYDSSTDNQLGDYGIDTTNGTVWAIVDHNSEFAVVTSPVPEPSAWWLLGFSLTALVLLRRRVRLRQ